MLKNIMIVLVLGGLGYWAFTAFAQEEKSSSIAFITLGIDSGEVVETVSASGEVKPITMVEVGSQVSGRIEKIYVDFNSRVKKGQLICQLDTVPLEARVSQDKANLLKAKAQLKRVRANLELERKELVNTRKLAKEKFISQFELNKEIASVKALEAEEELALAEIDQSKASLEVSQASLNYAKIISPVDGIVITRNVDEGQTVAASFQAPVLFEIAQNLNEVHILASVGEADIGQVQKGQKVSFRVDAYPDDVFQGEVSQVRLVPFIEQNVVTYTVVVGANNDTLKLFPGMTANLLFEIGRSKERELRVPNAATRFEPQKEWVVGELPEPLPFHRRNKRIWVMEGEKMKPVDIVVGYSDRMYSQLKEGGLTEDMEVVTGIRLEDEKDDEMTNPFARKRKSSNKNKNKKKSK